MPEDRVAAEIARLAAALPPTGAPRLERLRGIGSKLVCTCSRVSLPGDAHGILVIASEPARPALPLAERADAAVRAGQRTGRGVLRRGRAALRDRRARSRHDARDARRRRLKGDAIAAGRATGESALGPLTLERLGSGSTTVLVATLPDAHEKRRSSARGRARSKRRKTKLGSIREPSSEPTGAARNADAESALTPSEDPAACPNPRATPRRHPSRARCSPSCRPPRTSCRSAAPRPPRSAPA